MFDNMFDNIGEKIKKYVKSFACVGMTASIIIGVVCCIFGGSVGIIAGILVGVLGFLGSWVGAWMMYGYGEMVQRLINIDRKLSSVQKQDSRTRNFDPNRFKQVEKAEDKETLYKFALEQIDKKQYAFARDALKRIAGYKDSDEILARIESL